MKEAKKVVRAGRWIKGLKGNVVGEAVVVNQPIHFMRDVDEATGIIDADGHSGFGKSIANKIAVFPTAPGGVGSAWRIVTLSKNGVAPKAILNNVTNPVIVQGCILANIPVLDKFNTDILSLIEDGDQVNINNENGIVEITKSKK